MEVRPARKEDFSSLVELHKEHDFPFPSFKNILDILVVEEDGNIIAWGYTKKFVEIVFVPNLELSGFKKVKSLKLLSEKSTELTKARGIEQVHSFVKNERLATFLVNHFNYKVCKGEPLFLDMDDNGKE